jgi:hypothetical protein
LPQDVLLLRLRRSEGFEVLEEAGKLVSPKGRLGYHS